MGFNQSQYEAATERVRSGVQKLGVNSRLIMPAANKASNEWYLPPSVKEAVVWTAGQLVEITDWFIAKVEELLSGAVAPVAFFELGWQWEELKGKASGVQGTLNPDALGSRSWEGAAKDGYRAAIKLQSPAAGRIKEIANSTATSLYLCAAAGLAFYIALGAIVFQLLGVLNAALAALLSGVFSLAGLVAAVGDAGVTAGLIWACVGALTTCLGLQVQQMGVLHGEAIDETFFPQGRWPKGTV